ncbi:unnamed protein product, partial [Musa acuminata subsp. burmannicoides]
TRGLKSSKTLSSHSIAEMMSAKCNCRPATRPPYQCCNSRHSSLRSSIYVHLPRLFHHQVLARPPWKLLVG